MCKKPLEERRKLLSVVVRPVPTKFELIECKTVGRGPDENERRGAITTWVGCVCVCVCVCVSVLTKLPTHTHTQPNHSYFQSAVEKGWEGLVIKRLQGPYQAGKKSREIGG